ncbi:MAG: isoprenylcysteine carboxylmethyltransferase family protein [Candidatus Bathyarchaeota archaeon]|nr:isoprenylcysteine carboxylmethyltransferase family protein [Candidatus Bathyarchaeota archaeon]
MGIMFLVPAFELGLWNAWIFMVYVVLCNFLPYLLAGKLFDEKALNRLATVDTPQKDNQKRLLNVYSVLFFGMVAFSIFLPLTQDTTWFVVGLTIYILGVIVETTSITNFLTTPADKPVNKGVYRFSRNPMYLGMFLIFVGTSIACVSVLFLVLTAMFTAVSHLVVVAEEQVCTQKYGEPYQNYLNRIPRWIGIPKSSRIED